MGDASGQENQRFGSCMGYLFSPLDIQIAFKDVQEAIFLMVNVKRPVQDLGP